MKTVEQFKRSIDRANLPSTAIREELKKAFPDVKFKVRYDSFAGGDSVDVSYTDGVTEKQVEELIGKYQYGEFDGMTDCYEYTNSRDDIPQTKYLHIRREYSDAIFKDAVKVLCEDQGIDFETCDYNTMFYKDNFDYSRTVWNIARRILNKFDLRSYWKVMRDHEVTAGHIEDFYTVLSKSEKDGE